ncbi:protein L-Myc-1a [Trichomycterus rosablanca]|uniref:protein L-Myc-1a n=1 Tax=Trichomycterus rosablanca TaxID=2290929 RepID=UPI002F35BE77
MECDHHPHYFYDGMDSRIEDFFTSTAPSEDIWKKFELLPTPPVSPSRTFAMGRTVFPLSSERGMWPSDDYLPFKFDPLDVIGNLSSVVIKDCMWSGGFSATRVNPRTETQSERELNVPRTQGPRVADVATTRCVNPAAVLNLPSHQPKKQMTASSGSESRSDSSDADEIDVVTVENRLKKQTRTPITIAVSADPHGPCKKYFHISLHRQQHNYAAPSPDSDMEHEEQGEDLLNKQARLDASLLSAPSSSSSSPASSDSEDSNEHRRNFLERKRRDNLRSRFQLLRNEIPGLSDTAKSSKVAILTRATEYLLQLQVKERRQAQERKKLRAKRQQLLRKISLLKKC